MSDTATGFDLKHFATALIEQSGGIVEWHHDDKDGTAVVPEVVAGSLNQAADTFRIGPELFRGGLSLNLGGEFVELAKRTLQRFVPMVGGFALVDIPLKKSAFEDAVDRSFGWQNSRVRVCDGNVIHVPYHTWWFQMVLQSEDTWESLSSVTINGHSQIRLNIDELLDAFELKPANRMTAAPESTLATARRCVETDMLSQASDFMTRLDQRLQRDQQRLRDYYSALQREAKTPNRRTKTPPTPEEVNAKVRAVKMELQRKLTEQEDRYALRGTLRPIAMAEFLIPAMAIEIHVQRKSALRKFRLYWNSLLKKLEPMSCSECGQDGYNFWFANETVAPLCKFCHG